MADFIAITLIYIAGCYTLALLSLSVGIEVYRPYGDISQRFLTIASMVITLTAIGGTISFAIRGTTLSTVVSSTIVFLITTVVFATYALIFD